MTELDYPIVLALLHDSSAHQQPLIINVDHLMRGTNHEKAFSDLVAVFGEAKLAVICVGLTLSNGKINDMVVDARDKNPNIPIVVRYEDGDNRIGKEPFEQHENVYFEGESKAIECIQGLLAA